MKTRAALVLGALTMSILAGSCSSDGGGGSGGGSGESGEGNDRPTAAEIAEALPGDPSLAECYGREFASSEATDEVLRSIVAEGMLVGTADEGDPEQEAIVNDIIELCTAEFLESERGG